MGAPSFSEVRVNDLIESVSLQTVGGRQFSTSIVATAAGFEKRNISWAQSRGRWEFGDRVVLQSELDALIDFFESVGGKAMGFRFKDWSDFKCKPAAGVLAQISAEDRTYQLQKRYGSRLKNIRKPVAVQLYDDGEVVPMEAYAYSGTTGILTMVDEPVGTLTWQGEFDLPARFDTDQLQTKFEAIDEDTQDAVHYLYSLPVVELRV